MTKQNGALPKPSTRTDVAEEWIEKEVFIYDHASSDEVHNLNSGAALIWLLCDGTRDVKSIASTIAEEFDLAGNEVLHEVEATVEYFGTLNLLENGQPSTKEVRDD